MDRSQYCLIFDNQAVNTILSQSVSLTSKIQFIILFEQVLRLNQIDYTILNHLFSYKAQQNDYYEYITVLLEWLEQQNILQYVVNADIQNFNQFLAIYCSGDTLFVLKQNKQKLKCYYQKLKQLVTNNNGQQIQQSYLEIIKFIYLKQIRPQKKSIKQKMNLIDKYINKDFYDQLVDSIVEYIQIEAQPTREDCIIIFQLICLINQYNKENLLYLHIKNYYWQQFAEYIDQLRQNSNSKVNILIFSCLYNFIKQENEEIIINVSLDSIPDYQLQFIQDQFQFSIIQN